MVRCSAVRCSISSTSNNLSFHRLHNLIELRKKWLQPMRPADIEEDQKILLCSTHFNPEDIKRDYKLSELQCQMLYLFFIYIDMQSFIKHNQ